MNAGKGRIMWLGICDSLFAFSRKSLTNSEARLQYQTICQRNMIQPGVSKSTCLKRKVFTVHFCVLIILQCMLSSMGHVRTDQTLPIRGPCNSREAAAAPVQLSHPWLPLDLPKDKWLTTSSSVMHNTSVISAKFRGGFTVQTQTCWVTWSAFTANVM